MLFLDFTDRLIRILLLCFPTSILASDSFDCFLVARNDLTVGIVADYLRCFMDDPFVGFMKFGVYSY